MGLIRNYIYITVSRVIMRNNTNDKKLAEYSVFGLVATENQKILLFPFLNVINLLITMLLGDKLRSVSLSAIEK